MLAEAIEVFEHQRELRASDLLSPIIAAPDPSSELDAMLAENLRDGRFVVQEDAPTAIDVFGRSITLPLREFVAENVRLRLQAPRAADGGRVSLELSPLAGFRGYYQYVERPRPSPPVE